MQQPVRVGQDLKCAVCHKIVVTEVDTLKRKFSGVIFSKESSNGDIYGLWDFSGKNLNGVSALNLSLGT